MNKNAIKKFATESRTWLREKITTKLNELGITEEGIGGPVQQTGTEVKVTDLSVPVNRVQYESLRSYVLGIKRSYSENWYDELVEECSYSWFNRFIGIKYMEVNGYLPDKINILTSSSGKMEPDIVHNYEFLSFAGRLDKEFIRNGLLEHKTDAVFRYLFLEQNHELSKIMPFMFNAENSYSDLVFPDGILGDAGIVSKINEMVDGEDWKEIEIIGWLYQFYNSDRKDEVFAGLAKNEKITKENIPAATQLFTPKWIVKYMVENSLGKLALEEAGVNDRILEKWKYFIDNPENEVKRDKSINIEDVKVLDPAMGSGHILVYAFDVLYQIYEELGYGKKEAVVSILNNNLLGMDIDDRAAQLASFALLMKGREYYARIFSAIDSGEIELHTVAIQESNSIEESTRQTIESSGLENLVKLIRLFENAKELGSIIDVEGIDVEKLEEERKSLEVGDGLFYSLYSGKLGVMIKQAKILARKYDVVVTNPPYMGSKGMGIRLKEYVEKRYKDSKADLFAVFMEKCGKLTKKDRYTAMITMHSWMFLSSFEKLRKSIVENSKIDTLVHLGARAFEEIGGEIVQTVAWVEQKRIQKEKGVYVRLTDFKNAEEKERQLLNPENRYTANQADFEKIPGSPIAYWVSERVKEIFVEGKKLEDIAEVRKGMDTADNNKFMRNWQEVEIKKFGIGLRFGEETVLLSKKWVPYNKGGEYKKWYGNQEYVINWENDGEELKKFEKSNLRSKHLYFKESLSWTLLSSSKFGLRYYPVGFIFDSNGSSIFSDNLKIKYLESFLLSKISFKILQILSSTMAFNIGDLAKVPIIFSKNEATKQTIDTLTQSCIDISHTEWDSRETSWDFTNSQLVTDNTQLITHSYNTYCTYWLEQFTTLHKNEEELNRLFIEIYGLQNEMTPDVSFDDITILKKELPDRTKIPELLASATKPDPTKLFNKTELMKQLLSYAVGCNMGRYSIDKEGLIIANSDDKLLIDSNHWKVLGSDGEIRHDIPNARYIPDDDAIVPITDTNYFVGEDIVERLEDFLVAVYGADTLEENLNFIANGIKESNTPARETLRNYFMGDFMADHLKRYSNRPIYWMVSSNNKGKGAAFNAIIYLHRYSKNTIPGIRGKYVNELQAKLRSKEESVEKRLLDDSLNAKDKKELKAEKDKYRSQINELLEFDKKLNDLANQMIELDLDDGVKVNYKKLESILYKVKFGADEG